MHFQHQYGLDPTYAREALPVLGLLDLHDMSRPDVYAQLLQSLVARLRDRIKSGELTAEQHHNLLLTTFPYISFEELREIPITLLQTDPTLRPELLQQLSDNAELYRACPLDIQRRIWQVSGPYALSLSLSLAYSLSLSGRRLKP